jgi:flagellar hook-associated protein 2
MAGVASIGVGSGLDLESLVNGLIEAERTPKLTALDAREADIQANISAFGSLRSALDQLETKTALLSDAQSLQKRTATSSNTDYFTASAGTDAVAGQYDIQVLNLARAQKLVTTADFADAGAAVGAGTLTIGVGSSSFDVTTDADTTLGELKDLINEASGNTGVTASLIVVAADPLDADAGTVARLVLSADETGADNAVEIAVADDDGNDTDAAGLSRFYFSSADLAGSQLDQQQEAVDARIAVDGFAAFSSTNTFSDVIDGVTITAQREPADPLDPEIATLTIGLNTGAVAARVNEFVEAYNEVVTTINDVASFNAATETAGPLNGDSTVRSIQSRLRSVLGSAVGSETGGPQTLAELGITTQRDGTLTVDNAQLNEALESNFAEVSALFASENGIAIRLEETLDSFIGRDGILNSRSEGFDRQLESIEDEREALELRLEKLESTFRDRFTALDLLVAQLQNSGDFLVTQLQNTASIIGRTPGGSEG